MLEKYRIDLHQIPEIGEELYETKKYILNRLKDLKCKIEIINCSIIAFFDFNAKYSLGFRSDMDGLMIEEKTNLLFKSKKNMHACGHDGHMAMLLALADHLDKLKFLDKNVVLIFEEAEELGVGADKIVNSKILEKYHLKAIFAYHLWPNFEFGKILSKSEIMTSFSSEIFIEIYGVSSHLTKYISSVDALELGCKLISDLYKIKKEYNYLLRFGIFNSGKVLNSISDYTVIKGSIRSFYFLDFIDLYKEIINIKNKYKAKIIIKLKSFNLGVDNDIELFNKAKNIIPITNLNTPSLIAEDFARYKSICPILFLFLGIGEGKEELHSDKFDFDMSVLEIGLKNYIKLLSIKY